MAKIATIVQTAWFLLQCLARLIQSISITSLELSTIAFVVCTIGTNIMWWAKPKDVFVPVVLKIDHTLEGLLAIVCPQIQDPKSEVWIWSPLERLDNLRPNFLVDVGQQYLSRINSFELSQSDQKLRFRNDRLPPLERDWPLNHFLSILSLAFGAVYLAGWNIDFPTGIEQLIWRICTVMMFSLVGAFWAVDAGVELHQKKKKVPKDQKVALTPVKMALYALISIVYVIIRLYILVEPFIGLRSLSTVTFESVQWVNFIPHF